MLQLGPYIFLGKLTFYTFIVLQAVLIRDYVVQEIRYVLNPHNLEFPDLQAFPIQRINAILSAWQLNNLE